MFFADHLHAKAEILTRSFLQRGWLSAWNCLPPSPSFMSYAWSKQNWLYTHENRFHYHERKGSYKRVSCDLYGSRHVTDSVGKTTFYTRMEDSAIIWHRPSPIQPTCTAWWQAWNFCNYSFNLCFEPKTDQPNRSHSMQITNSCCSLTEIVNLTIYNKNKSNSKIVSVKYNFISCILRCATLKSNSFCNLI